MPFELYPFQQEIVDAGVRFLTTKKKGAIKWNGLIVAPTGSGKSLMIAKIVEALNAPTLVFQPSKEILEQNRAKFQEYGYDPAICSASVSANKQIGDITLATIGSTDPSWFSDMEYVIVDECHAINAAEGMYRDFFFELGRVKVLGLTASPYRLVTSMSGSMLRFLTRSTPRVFNEVVAYVQNGDLFAQGYLAKMKYYQIDGGFDPEAIPLNSSGTDYDQAALQLSLFENNTFKDKTAEVVERLLKAGRRNVLVFVRFVWQGETLVKQVPGVHLLTGETPKLEREDVLRRFQAGDIKVVVNCNVLGIGFDFPQLECVLQAAPTKSLSRYYQQIGRGVRVHAEKSEAWVVDLVGGYEKFGRVEDLALRRERGKLWYVAGKPGGRHEVQLTDVTMEGSERRCKKCSSTSIFFARSEEDYKQAMLSRPVPGGREPDLVLKKNVHDKTVYAKAGPGEHGEFLFHWWICKKKKK